MVSNQMFSNIQFVNMEESCFAAVKLKRKKTENHFKLDNTLF